MIHIYNSLSGEKKSLPAPKEQKKIRLFVCGPTVYDYAHIGHARTYIFFDFLAKYLRSQGYEVNYLQNITDVDDKIIKRAAEQKKDPLELSKEFTEAYFEDMAALGVDAITEYAPATKFITQIAAQIERLIDKGFAYKIEGDGWYFDIAKDEDYGKLSHRTTEQAEDATSRIDEAIGKRNKGDFCLWKFSKADAAQNNEPSWNTSLGAGRPGWHIEDTAISEFYFGPQYEIHGGGVDLKFPHHEAEIAQQESASGLKPFVQFWMHTGALLVDGKKMSKSVGNFITIRDFLKKYPPEVLRLIVLKHHYRSPMDFTDDLAEEAQKNLLTIASFITKLKFSAKEHVAQGNDIPKELLEALDDDINTPKMFATLYSFITTQQEKIWDIEPAKAARIAKHLENLFSMLNISLPNPKIPSKARQLTEERELSRAGKQFEHSDRLRKEINDLGYDIEDTPKGPFLWPRQSNQN